MSEFAEMMADAFLAWMKEQDFAVETPGECVFTLTEAEVARLSSAFMAGFNYGSGASK